MSTSIWFLREDDEEHRKKVAVLRACKTAEVPLPPEIMTYFDGTFDEDAPLRIKASELQYQWKDEGSQGFEVDLTQLPKGVRRIRFINSW